MKPNDVTKSDHEYIWLEPALHENESYESYSGRQWCQDDVWSGECVGEECGGPTKYVRSDLYDAILLKLNEREWISVIDRRPELTAAQRKPNAFGVAVLIWPQYHPEGTSLTPFAYYGRRHSDTPEFYIYGRVIDVTHWMPLPEPPPK